MASTWYLVRFFHFCSVFFYLVTTGWVFDMSLGEDSINQSNDLCHQRGGYRQEYGRIEVDSLLTRRRRTLAAWSAVIEMLEDNEN